VKNPMFMQRQSAALRATQFKVALSSKFLFS
jgi:hypothetical protein